MGQENSKPSSDKRKLVQSSPGKPILKTEKSKSMSKGSTTSKGITWSDLGEFNQVKSNVIRYRSDQNEQLKSIQNLKLDSLNLKEKVKKLSAHIEKVEQKVDRQVQRSNYQLFEQTLGMPYDLRSGTKPDNRAALKSSSSLASGLSSIGRFAPAIKPTLATTQSYMTDIQTPATPGGGGGTTQTKGGATTQMGGGGTPQSQQDIQVQVQVDLESQGAAGVNLGAKPKVSFANQTPNTGQNESYAKTLKKGLSASVDDLIQLNESKESQNPNEVDNQDSHLTHAERRPTLRQARDFALSYLQHNLKIGPETYGQAGFCMVEAQNKARYEIMLMRYVREYEQQVNRLEVNHANELTNKIQDSYDRWKNSTEWFYGCLVDFKGQDPVIAEAVEKVKNEYHTICKVIDRVLGSLTDFVVSSADPQLQHQLEETLDGNYGEPQSHSSPFGSDEGMVTANEFIDETVRNTSMIAGSGQVLQNVASQLPQGEQLWSEQLVVGNELDRQSTQAIDPNSLMVRDPKVSKGTHVPVVPQPMSFTSHDPFLGPAPSMGHGIGFPQAHMGPTGQVNMGPAGMGLYGHGYPGMGNPRMGFTQTGYPGMGQPGMGGIGMGPRMRGPSMVNSGLRMGYPGMGQPTMGQQVFGGQQRLRQTQPQSWPPHPGMQGTNPFEGLQPQQSMGDQFGGFFDPGHQPATQLPYQGTDPMVYTMQYYMQSMDATARTLMEHFDSSGRILREPSRSHGSLKLKLLKSSTPDETALFWAAFEENYEFVNQSWLTKITHLHGMLDGELQKTVTSFQINSGMNLPLVQKEMFYKCMYFRIKAVLLKRGAADNIVHLEDLIGNLPMVDVQSSVDVFYALQDILTRIAALAPGEMNSRGSSYLRQIGKKLKLTLFLELKRHIRQYGLPKNLMSLQDFIAHKTEDLREALLFNESRAVKKQESKDSKAKAKETKINSYSTSITTLGSGNNSGSQNDQKQNEKDNANCPCCSQAHQVYECPAFLRLSQESRADIVKKYKLCFHCLRRRHGFCKEYKKCDKCKKGHHSKLSCAKVDSNRNSKPGNNWKPKPSSEGGKDETLEASSHHIQTSSYSSSKYSPFLIQVFVKNQVNNEAIATVAYIDHGTDTSIFYKPLAAKIGMKGEETKVRLSTLNKTEVSQGLRCENAVIEALDGSYQSPLNCVALDYRPKFQMVDFARFKRKYRHLQDIHFPQGPATEVGVLIGRDNMHLINSIEMRQGLVGQPIALRFPLGWALSVPAIDLVGATCYATSVTTVEDSQDSTHKKPEKASKVSCKENTCPHNILEAMAKVESIGVFEKESKYSPAQDRTLKRLQASLKINDMQEVEIEIPMNGLVEELVNNFEKVKSRQVMLEKKLVRKQIYELYWSLLVQAMEKGYIKEIDDPNPAVGKKFYVPHFFVLKPESTSTPVRIVFDAKARAGTTISFNEAIDEAPDLQNSLSDILLNFRKGKIAFAMDVKQMFSQVAIPEHQHDLNRFIFRPPGEEEFRVFAHKKWWFGNHASPAAAQLACTKTAEDMKEETPLGSETVKEKRYMDDTIDSKDSLETAEQTVRECIKIYDCCGMDIQKFISNSKTLMHSVSQDRRHKEYQSGKLPGTTVLGYEFDPELDILSLQPVDHHPDAPTTKRGLLHEIASVYDPIGFGSPFPVLGRKLLQRCWRIEMLGWDDDLPSDLQGDVNRLHSQLPHLPELKVPRQVISEPVQSIHIFCDSSEDSYGVTGYAVGETESGLLISKGRVHPNKPMSIPRKELQACVLGAKIGNTLARTYPGVPITYWTDSVNCICWIKNDSKRMKQFVGNRVAYIQEHSDPARWNWVGTDQNPADIVSRGMNLTELIGNEFWFKGPRFLFDKEVEWPEQKSFGSPGEEMKKEGYKEIFSLYVRADDIPDIEGFEKLDDLVTAMVHKIRISSGQDPNAAITTREQDEALLELVKIAQEEGYESELRSLRSNESVVQRNSSVFKLCPVLDDHGVIRLKTRLANSSSLPYSVRFPILLPKDHHLSKLIILDIHDRIQHSYGNNYILSVLREKYWVPKGLQLVKKVRKSCVSCQRIHGKPQIPQMAPLPPFRVDQPLQAFQEVGVDFTGAFSTIQGRGRVRLKRYGCIFTCMATRAVHIELAGSLSTSDFFDCLTRFVARKGKPANLYSDRGTNFVGASTELRQILAELDADAVQEYSRKIGFNFVFNPPFSPHMGGVWESMVKSLKRAIYAILTDREFTDLELLTVFCQAEDIVNSRPLAFSNADANDFTVLTPNSFLTGRLDNQIFPDSIDTTRFSLEPRDRWRYIQRATRDVWRRWIREILPTLGRRSKWIHDGREYIVGDAVLVMDKNLPRYKWIPGKITQVFHGRDNRVRVVKILTEDGEMESNVHRLIPLT